jgi:hypothetical protein
MFKTTEGLVCKQCGRCGSIIENNYDTNLTFKERNQMNNDSLIKSKNSVLYPSVYNHLRAIPDLQDVDEVIISNLARITMDYIDLIETKSGLYHMTIPRIKSVLVTTCIMFALRSQKAIVGISETKIIRSSPEYDEKMKNKVLQYFSVIKICGFFPHYRLSDETTHRQEVFHRWCNELDIDYCYRGKIYELLLHSTREVWFGGRTFEFASASVFRHVLVDKCSKIKVPTEIEEKDIQMIIEAEFNINWKSLAHGCHILCKLHDGS